MPLPTRVVLMIIRRHQHRMGVLALAAASAVTLVACYDDSDRQTARETVEEIETPDLLENNGSVAGSEFSMTRSIKAETQAITASENYQIVVEDRSNLYSTGTENWSMQVERKGL